jgi:hypothetical protein
MVKVDINPKFNTLSVRRMSKRLSVRESRWQVSYLQAINLLADKLTGPNPLLFRTRTVLQIYEMMSESKFFNVVILQPARRHLFNVAFKRSFVIQAQAETYLTVGLIQKKVYSSLTWAIQRFRVAYHHHEYIFYYKVWLINSIMPFDMFGLLARDVILFI